MNAGDFIGRRIHFQEKTTEKPKIIIGKVAIKKLLKKYQNVYNI